MTFANLKKSGKIPLLHELLIMVLSGLHTISETDFKREDGRLFGPVLLFVLIVVSGADLDYVNLVK